MVKNTLIGDPKKGYEVSPETQVKNAIKFMEAARTGEIDGNPVNYIPGCLYTNNLQEAGDFDGSYCTVGLGDKVLQENMAKTCKPFKLSNYDYAVFDAGMGVKNNSILVDFNDSVANKIHDANGKDHKQTWKAIYNHALKRVDDVFEHHVAKEIKKRFKHEE